jgi:hypothetical protein
VSQPELSHLPAEVQLAILNADPGAALSMMNTSHRMEQLVADGLLRPLLNQCSGSITGLREFITVARKAGRTPEQIFAVAAALGGKHPGALGMQFVRLGLLTPRGFNALSDTLIEMLSLRDVLLYAMGRSKPLLNDSDLSDPAVLAGTKRPSSSCECAMAFSTMTIYYSEFHKVFRRIAIAVGEHGVVQCSDAQYRHSREVPGRLIYHPGRCREEVETMARKDAVTIARVLRLFLSAEALTAIDGRPVTHNGLLCLRKPVWPGDGTPEKASAITTPQPTSSCVVL